MSRTLRLLKKELSPHRIILFGSRAKGSTQRNSDFDIAVDAAPPLATKRRTVAQKIDEIAGLYRVDLVFLRQVSKDFRDIILKTGRVLYER